MKKRLTIDSNNTMIGGVLGGVAKYIGMDSTILRILFVAMCFMLHDYVSSIMIAYFLAYIIIPVEEDVE